MDWSNVTTGLVGLAGIGGTILSARMAGNSASRNLQTSISAENQRADRAEQRRVYSHFLGLVLHAIEERAYQERAKEEDRAAAKIDADRAVFNAADTAHEVKLIGSDLVGSHVDKVMGLLVQLDYPEVPQSHALTPKQLHSKAQMLSQAHTEMFRAMRADLVEPGTPLPS